MLKWIGGCAVLVIVLLAAGMWYAMRTMRGSLSPDGVERVAIAAPPARVFASLATGDSIATWMAQGNRVRTSAGGLLEKGDSIAIETPVRLGMKQAPMTWVVQRIDSNRARVLELTSSAVAGPMAIRYDSLVAMGDSTIVLSTIRWSFSPADSAKAASSTAELMLSMFRMQSKLELQSLKSRIEARPQTPTR